ncbi:elfless isoform b [Anaeramoeba flamelloides]|uniref:Elfless isoform b n=1 Tax=Anaeramoeba flamelloides TaxID=1746091 RepID=A0AAV8A149_9EUKA|nr:elfless isoform b [Anaeramoeba flamelloides]
MILLGLSNEFIDLTQIPDLHPDQNKRKRLFSVSSQQKKQGDSFKQTSYNRFKKSKKNNKSSPFTNSHHRQRKLQNHLKHKHQYSDKFRGRVLQNSFDNQKDSKKKRNKKRRKRKLKKKKEKEEKEQGGVESVEQQQQQQQQEQQQEQEKMEKKDLSDCSDDEIEFVSEMVGLNNFQYLESNILNANHLKREENEETQEKEGRIEREENKEKETKKKKIWYPQCCICLERIKENSVSTACGHIFHRGCIEEWLDIEKICPYCKTRQTKRNIHNIYF